MPEYKVYHELGDDKDAEEHLSCNAPNLLEVLKRLTARGRSVGTFSIRNMTNGVHMAEVECDIFGNWSAQLLQSVVYEPDLPYATQRWAYYGVNGLGEWFRLNLDEYRGQASRRG
jgi:hypothetical protein